MTTGLKMASATEPKLFRDLTPADPFREFQRRLNRLFGPVFASFFPDREESWSLMNWAPACDIYETENLIVV